MNEYINSHSEARKLACLFKRKISGVYLFGSRRISVKLENGRLYGMVLLFQPYLLLTVKAGQSYLAIDSFVSLHLDLEHERLLLDSTAL